MTTNQQQISHREAVVRLLQASGLSESELAQILGVTPMTLRAWIAGTVSIPVRYRRHVATVYRRVARITGTPTRRRHEIMASRGGPNLFDSLRRVAPKRLVAAAAASTPTPSSDEPGLDY